MKNFGGISKGEDDDTDALKSQNSIQNSNVTITERKSKIEPLALRLSRTKPKVKLN